MSDERNLFHDADTARDVMGELAGYTSLCWVEQNNERVFDSERASKAVDQAMDRLEELGFLDSENNKEKN